MYRVEKNVKQGTRLVRTHNWSLACACLALWLVAVQWLPAYSHPPSKTISAKNRLLGSWRNDRQRESISFSPDGYVSDNGNSVPWGKYELTDTNRVQIQLMPWKKDEVENPNQVRGKSKIYKATLNSGELVLKDPNGKITKYLRGIPIVPSQSKEESTVIVKCDMTMSPGAIEEAILVLSPTRIEVYQPHQGYRTIAITVEKEAVNEAFQKARKDRAFASVKIASRAGVDREQEWGRMLEIGSSYDELAYRPKKGVSKEQIEQSIVRLGGIPSGDTAHFAKGHLLPAFISLQGDPNFEDVRLHHTDQREHCLMVATRLDISLDQLERALLGLHPQYIHVGRPVGESRFFGISFKGPRSLERAYEIAQSDRAFLSVELPTVEMRTKWNRMRFHSALDATGGFPEPYNELMIFPRADVPQAQINASLRQLGGMVVESPDFRLVKFKNGHVISGYLRALSDKNFAAVNQNGLVCLP